MDMESRKLSPGHDTKRARLRLIGWICLPLGIVLIISGGVQMFGSFVAHEPQLMDRHTPIDQTWVATQRSHRSAARSTFGGFGMVALGMFLSAGGGIMLKLGYMGAIARYVAGEGAPVVGDAINFLGAKTQKGMHDVSQAIASGVRSGWSNPNPPQQPPSEHSRQVSGVCPKCGAVNASNARFCNQCGGTMSNEG